MIHRQSPTRQCENEVHNCPRSTCGFLTGALCRFIKKPTQLDMTAVVETMNKLHAGFKEQGRKKLWDKKALKTFDGEKWHDACPPMFKQLGGTRSWATTFQEAFAITFFLLWETCPICHLDSLTSNCLAPNIWRRNPEYQYTRIQAYAKCLHWDPHTSVLTGIKRWILRPIPQPFVVGIQVVIFILPSASTIQPSIHRFECAGQSGHKAINQIRRVPPYVLHAYWSHWHSWTSYPHLLGCSSWKRAIHQYCHWILPPKTHAWKPKVDFEIALVPCTSFSLQHLEGKPFVQNSYSCPQFTSTISLIFDPVAAACAHAKALAFLKNIAPLLVTCCFGTMNEVFEIILIKQCSSHPASTELAEVKVK